MLLLIFIVLSAIIFFKLFREFGKSQTIMANLSEEDKLKFQQVMEQIASQNAQSVEQTSAPQQPQIEGLSQLMEKFPDFSLSAFLLKADEIFDKIMFALAESDLNTLKEFLSDSLYQKFMDIIKRREEHNLNQELTLDHRKTQPEKIQMLDEKVSILVSFELSQMSALINSEGVSFDNPKRICRNVLHKWIFERRYTESNWTISQTTASEI